MNIEEIQKKLSSSKSKDRRRAAKAIGSEKIQGLGNDLYSAYLKEKKDKRTWETQFSMIHSLGLINYSDSLDVITEIVETNEPHDMITTAAAESYVRLKRQSINDAQPVLELLKKGAHSVICGCLNPLGYDQMIPPEAEIKELIKLAWDLHENTEKHFCDPRYALAAACAGWNPVLTKGFLEHCLETGDVPVQYVAEKSLKGKYVKLR